MEPAPIGVVTQVRFERMVRDLFDHMAEGWWTFNPMASAVKIARILTVLDHQPELLEGGHRLSHNLGDVKMRWLRQLYEDYQTFRQNEVRS